MHQLFVLLAEYNAEANGQMFGILEKAPPELLTRPVGSYYKTILGMLNHTLAADLGWLNAYRESGLKARALDSPALEFQRPAPGTLLYDSLAPLWERRRQVDAVFRELAAELSDEQLKGPILINNPWRGTTERFVLGEVLLHLFNHHTHHRGQVSQVLDSAGIENDYSNIVSLLRRASAAEGGGATAGAQEAPAT